MTDLTPRHAPPGRGRADRHAPPDRGRAERHAPANDAVRAVRRRRIAVGIVVALLVLAGAFIAIQGLRNATLFFRNVDEAVAQADELGDRRFRLQGRVVLGTVATSGGVTTFDVVHNCAIASVQHTTDPPELFDSPWIPVVLEGSWRASASSEGAATQGASNQGASNEDAQGRYFLSDRMLVKHTNEYEAANAERLADSDEPNPLEGCDTTT